MADDAADEAVDFLPAELAYDPAADEAAAVDEAEVAEDGDENVARRRRVRRTRRIVLGAMLAVLLGLVIVFGPTAWEIFLQKDTTLVTPQKIAGLTLDQTEDAQGTADYLKTALAAGVALDSTIGAVYTDGGGTEHSVIIVGGTGLFLAPEKQLDAAFGLITDDTGGVTGVRTVPAGPLGGVMKCGTTTTDDDSTIPVCGWADHGSLAVALFPGRALDESADLLRQMRAAMQHR
jgi:hypothetical protein